VGVLGLVRAFFLCMLRRCYIPVLLFLVEEEDEEGDNDGDGDEDEDDA